MQGIIAKGLLIPFLGTALGSACVLFMKKELITKLQKSLSGFAAGVMIAAAVWSLLIPSMDQAVEQGMGKLGFIPAVIGFCLGMLFLLLLDVITPHMHLNETVEGPKSNLSKTTMMVLAVTLLLARFIIPVLPYLLSFAAGAMIYVVVEELVPEMASEENETHSNLGTIMFMIGFSLMMMLDVALG